nr:MAG TPA: hypothetical protein [Caudoviricetes sp.]
MAQRQPQANKRTNSPQSLRGVPQKSQSIVEPTPQANERTIVRKVCGKQP